MSEVNFPLNPDLNELYTFGLRTWRWNGVAWQSLNISVGFTGSNGFTGSQGDAGLNPWTVVADNYQAQDKDRLIADTRLGSFTVLLPSNPLQGAYVQITDGGGLDINPLTVSAPGATIEDQEVNIVIDVSNATFEFLYNGTTWQVTSTSGPRGDTGFTGSHGFTGSQGFTGSKGEGTVGTSIAIAIIFG
jgi:hypothetical protein